MNGGSGNDLFVFAPQFGELTLFSALSMPEAQDLLAAVGSDAERDVDGLVADDALVANLDPQRVEEDQRVDGLQRSDLPGGDLLQNSVRHRADEVGRDLDAVKLAQMPDDLAGAMPRAYIDTILSSKPGKRR